jgi:polysaccharide biosynthesis protein PslH
VVASPAAAEGIDAGASDGLIVAQDWRAQAGALLELLVNPARAKALGRAARARMIKRYSWDARLAELGNMLGLQE